jgi:hypothetical protein
MRNLDTCQKPAPCFSVTKFLRLGLLLFLMVCAANAAALHWQLNGVTFSDGGKVFGGFDFDAGTGVYSNINITTTPGSVLLQGSYYNSAAPYAGSTSSTSFNGVSTVPVFATSTLALALNFSSALTAAGGSVSIGGAAQESICTNSTCSAVTSQRPITAGTASAISTGAAKRWYVHDVVLSDGAQVFGSFIFDANTGTYSNISITTTGGKVASGAGYFFNIPASSSATSVSLVSASPIVSGTTTTLSMAFAAALSNAGGTVAITNEVEGTCTSVSCGASNPLRSTTVLGSVSTTQDTREVVILPQIADGGGFVTELIITNPTGAPLTCRITFWQDNGTFLPLSLNGANPSSSYVVLVPGHSTQFLSTPGLGASVTGWGLAENVEKLGVIATFRLKVSNLPESEATVEGIPATAGFAMAFDETPGYDTGFALANVSAFDTVIENLYFYDTNGNFIYSDSTRTLAPQQHESFLFSARYGGLLAGKRGTVRVYYGVQGTPANGTAGLTGLGLRVNPGGTFTSLPTFTID